MLCANQKHVLFCSISSDQGSPLMPTRTRASLLFDLARLVNDSAATADVVRTWNLVTEANSRARTRTMDNAAIANPHFSRGRAIGHRFRRDLKAGFMWA